MEGKRGAAIFEVRMGSSRNGAPQPQLAARFSRNAQERVARAVMLRLAAEVELATPTHESWCVVLAEPPDGMHFHIAIDTTDGTDEEAERALAVLHRVVLRGASETAGG